MASPRGGPLLVAVLVLAVGMSGCIEFFQPQLPDGTPLPTPTSSPSGSAPPTSSPGASATPGTSTTPPPTSPSPSPSVDPGETHTVRIVAGADCGVSTYSPSNVQIQVGDSVQWTNDDQCPHTATGTGSTPAFDTGNIPAGATSTAIVFDTAGTFQYKCAYHAAMPQSTVTVTA